MIYSKYVHQWFVISILLLLTAGGAAATWVFIARPGHNARALSDPARAQESCGVQALFVALTRLGVPTSLKSLEEELSPDDQGVDFGQLCNAAKLRGCEASLAKLDWGRLAAWDGTAVLWINGNHFVAVEPRWPRDNKDGLDNQLRIFDAGIPGQWWSRQQVESVWDGETLVLRKSANSPSATSQKPIAVWNECLVDTGYIEAGKTYSYVIGFRNAGSADLTARVAAVGCGCAKANLSSPTIAPGEAGQLTVSLDTGGRRGFYTTQVLIETNDPTCPQVPIYVRYGVDSTEVASSDMLFLGDIPRGAGASGYFIVYDSGRMKLQVNHAHAELADRPEGVSGIHTDVTATRIEPETDLPQIPQKLPMKVGDYVVGVTLHADSDAPLGSLSGRVSAVTAEGKKICVEFQGSVVSGFSVEPRALALTAIAGNPTEATLTVTPRAGLSIDAVTGRVDGDSAPKLLSLGRDKAGDGVRVRVKMGIPEPDKRSPFFGDLILDFGAGDIVRVPVVLKVGK